MKTTTYLHWLAAGVLLTGSTLAQGQSTNTNSTQSGSSATQSGSGSSQSGSGSMRSGSGSGSMQSGSMQSGSGMALSGTDKKFIMDAAYSNLAEISAGNLALQKGESPDVKSYAQKMIDAHTKAHDELKQLASTKSVTLPTEPKPKDKAMAMKMEKMSGMAFDKAYMKSQVKGHKETESAFQKELNGGKDAETKAWAEKTFPEIQGHTKMAQEMDGKMGSMTSSMNSGSSNSSTK